MAVPIWNKDKWREQNLSRDFPTANSRGSVLVIGCNYHTTWQSDKSMRFVLTEVKDGKARLQTRQTRKDFWVNVDDLIFIESKYNRQKANEFTRPNHFTDPGKMVNP